jgi:cytidine deaminase
LEELIKYSSIDDLNKEDKSLLEQAIKSREQAYAPYSHFNVGAAVLLVNGKVICGNNQENAVYPTGLCAERVAIFSAHANYPDQQIQAVAISCRHRDKPTTEPRTSCGSCRQALLEYEVNQEAPIKILFYGESGEVWQVNSSKTLLPWYFDRSALND